MLVECSRPVNQSRCSVMASGKQCEMKIFFTPEQLLHQQETEFNRGVLTAPFETPKRAVNALETLQSNFPGCIHGVEEFSPSYILDVHDAHYVEFLKTAYDEWHADGQSGDIFPMVWPVHGMRNDRIPSAIVGKTSCYSFEISTGITKNSWISARRSAEAALTGAREIENGADAAFSLCRPPGHHAGSAYYGGYCYLNNAAIAAQYLLQHGARRIAILDVDYHHGNGTQHIFYERSDVLYVSIHADPDTDFPYFLGYADEVGLGAGAGFNLNLPLPRGTEWSDYEGVLSHALGRVEAYGPDVLIVSLGVDTSEGDPLSKFILKKDDLKRMGAAIGKLRRKTLFVFEGGYDVGNLGDNVASVLTGFEHS